MLSENPWEALHACYELIFNQPQNDALFARVCQDNDMYSIDAFPEGMSVPLIVALYVVKKEPRLVAVSEGFSIRWMGSLGRYLTNFSGESVKWEDILNTKYLIRRL